MKTTRVGNMLRAGILAVGAFIAAPAALSVPPDKAEFAFDVVGFPVGDCGTFEIWNDFHGEGFEILHFDQEGNLESINVHTKVSESIYYNAEHPAIFVSGGPGEIENLRFDLTSSPPTVAITGVSFKVTLPGQGVIFMEAGRLIFDPETEEVLFQAGPKDVTEGDVAALCAALTP